MLEEEENGKAQEEKKIKSILLCDALGDITKVVSATSDILNGKTTALS